MPGNPQPDRFQFWEDERDPQPDLARAGNLLALTCLRAAIGASGLAPKQLADRCGMSEGYFSKVTNGTQGQGLAQVIDGLPAHVRDDFVARLREAYHGEHPLVAAVAQLAQSAIAVLALAGRDAKLPEKAGQPLKATVRADAKTRTK